MMVAATFHPQISEAAGFTGKEFLAWTVEDQKSYLEVQMVMAATIAARIKPILSDCLARKFYGNNGLSEKGLSQVVMEIRNYSDFHPSSVALVVMERECGGFD